MQMLKQNAYIEQLSRNEITITSVQNSDHMEYLRNKQTDWNAHGFEGNKLNKYGGKPLWKYGKVRVIENEC